MKETKELIMQVVFLLTACMSILAVILICVFMFANGLPAIAEIGPLKFLVTACVFPKNFIQLENKLKNKIKENRINRQC